MWGENVTRTKLRIWALFRRVRAVSHGGVWVWVWVWVWDDAWTIICVVDDPSHTLRYEIEYFRNFGIHTLSDDFKIRRQVREEVLLSQSGYGQF